MSRLQGSSRDLQQPWRGCKMVPERAVGLRASYTEKLEGPDPRGWEVQRHLVAISKLHKTHLH